MNDDIIRIRELEDQLSNIENSAKSISSQMHSISETLRNLSVINCELWKKYNEVLDELRKLKG